MLQKAMPLQEGSATNPDPKVEKLIRIWFHGILLECMGIDLEDYV